jgi:putative restriction endonuclease
MAGRPWTREEVLAVLNLYCRTPFGRLHARNPNMIRLAYALGRSPGSVAMKSVNLASLDPALRARGIRGLSKASQLDEAVWAQFHENPNEIGYESEVEFARLTGQSPRAADSVSWRDIRGLDKHVITKVRVNQHLFRAMILAGYRNECAVCELPIPALLVASHIVPWSADRAERMNPRNGICLCSLHDRAFDTGILLIKANYSIAVSIPAKAVTHVAVDKFLAAFDGGVLRLPDRWHPDPQLLQRHTDIVGRPRLI